MNPTVNLIIEQAEAYLRHDADHQFIYEDHYATIDDMMKTRDHDTIRVPASKEPKQGFKLFEQDKKVNQKRRNQRPSYMDAPRSRMQRCYSNLNERDFAVIRPMLQRQRSQSRLDYFKDRRNLLNMRFKISQGMYNFQVVDYDTDERVNGSKQILAQKFKSMSKNKLVVAQNRMNKKPRNYEM